MHASKNQKSSPILSYLYYQYIYLLGSTRILHVYIIIKTMEFQTTLIILKCTCIQTMQIPEELNESRSISSSSR